ncbi:MAG: tail fiber protein [Stenotrophomonas maltophilia]
MSAPFVGEIRMFGFNRVPSGWFSCNGALVSIAEYDVLFMLLGTTYGGDGQSTFGVPDLRGRVPLHMGQGPGLSNRPLGTLSGSETVTLTLPQMPAHTHGLSVAGGAATLEGPVGTALPGAVSGETFYVTDTNGATALEMEALAVTSSGGNQAHENCMPTLTVQYCIAWAGIFPSQA